MREEQDIDKLKDFLGVLCEIVGLVDAYRSGGSIFKVAIKGYKLLSEIKGIAGNMPEAALEYADLDADEKEDLKKYVERKIDLESFEIAEPVVESLVLAGLHLIRFYSFIKRP